MSRSGSAWILAVTCRCLTDDLDFLHEDCDRPVEELIDNPVIEDFVERRSERPIGSEAVQALLPGLVAFSLHSGRYRGATWYDRDGGAVWLLAVELHREGSRHDAYPYFERLHQANRLLPTRGDVERMVRGRSPTFKRVLLQELPWLRRTALGEPNTMHEMILGGRIPVRAIFENGDAGLLFFGITPQLLPGSVRLPVTWLVDILAAFFPDTPPEEIGYVPDLAGRPLREGEFCSAAWIWIK